ncbi:hypothetical protein DsansV1_C23g0176651 [Dioscorea sansibarensis]
MRKWPLSSSTALKFLCMNSRRSPESSFRTSISLLSSLFLSPPSSSIALITYDAPNDLLRFVMDVHPTSRTAGFLSGTRRLTARSLTRPSCFSRRAHLFQ